MNDHNLDDLIIDNIEPKHGKTKSLLTIIALLIVVLIVAIILTKTLLKSPTNPELSFEENNSEMIAPELKLQEKPKTSKAKEDDLSLSNIIEKEVKKPVEIKEETIVVDEEIIVEKTKPVEEEPITEKSTIKKEVETKENVQKIEITKPEQKKIETPKVLTPKVEAPKTVTKPKTTPKVVKTPTVTHKATSTVKYYVQVGSFAKDPSARLLSVVKNSGFTYSVSAPEANGNKRVLIGPYRSRAEVDKALKEVRDRITKSAFVFTK